MHLSKIIMTPFKSHLIFGLTLLATGIILGFLFVGWRISDAFKDDPVHYLVSFKKQLYDLTLLYVLALGFLNIALALLIPYFPGSSSLDWAIFGLIFSGSIFLIATGFWYAHAGPSFKWEPRCTALTISLLALVLGIGLEIYKVISRNLHL